MLTTSGDMPRSASERLPDETVNLEVAGCTVLSKSPNLVRALMDACQ